MVQCQPLALAIEERDSNLREGLEGGQRQGWVASHLRGSLRDVDFRDFCVSGGNKSSSDGSARVETMASALTSSHVMDTTCIQTALSSATHLRIHSWALRGLYDPLLFGRGKPPERQQVCQRAQIHQTCGQADPVIKSQQGGRLCTINLRCFGLGNARHTAPHGHRITSKCPRPRDSLLELDLMRRWRIALLSLGWKQQAVCSRLQLPTRPLSASLLQ